MKTKRTEPPSVAFDDGLAAGWAYAVCEAFRPALDIKMTDRVDPSASRKAGHPVLVRVWTEGSPPVYAFAIGDMIHHRSGSPSLQVQAVAADGRLSVALYHGTRHQHTYTLTQDQLAKLLSDGQLPANP